MSQPLDHWKAENLTIFSIFIVSVFSKWCNFGNFSNTTCLLSLPAGFAIQRVNGSAWEWHRSCHPDLVCSKKLLNFSFGESWDIDAVSGISVAASVWFKDASGKWATFCLSAGDGSSLIHLVICQTPKLLQSNIWVKDIRTASLVLMVLSPLAVLVDAAGL